MTAKITYNEPQMSVSELTKLLLANIDQDTHIELQRRKKSIILRGGENEILIAVISSLSVGLGALITGILKMMLQVKANKIIIKSKNGGSIEVPANFDIEKVGELVNKVKELDSENIDIAIE